MILNLIVVSLIILLTLYVASQGLLSAILSLITASFASILAMALFEPLEFLVGNYRPEYARGVTFLLLFFLALSGIRIGADYAVPKNIVLPVWIDRISAVVVGFFAAMVVIGTTVIGMEMLPLPTSILMYDRFPAKAEGATEATRDRMQALRDEGGKSKDVAGVVAPQTGIWLAPDRFVLGIWDMASGRSLGGATAFGANHPDLSVESYGYRNVVEKGSNHALLPNLVQVEAAYHDKDAADLLRFGLSESGFQALVIRTKIEQGSTQPLISADEGGMFRITPTEIRLVTDKGHQYYPVGYLDHGTKFVATSLATGILVDDYPASLKVVHDWVFPILEDEKPRLLEVKQLARIYAEDSPALSGTDKAAPFKALAAAEYPPHMDRQNPTVLTLTVELVNADKTRTLVNGADVYVLQSTVEKREVSGKTNTAYQNLVSINKQWEANQGGWGDQVAGKAGVPEKYTVQSWIQRGINEIDSKAPDDHLQWSTVVPMLLTGELTPDGRRNLDAANRYFDETLVPLMKGTRSFMKEGKTGADGKFTVTLTKGFYTYVVRAKAGEVVAVWCRDITAEPKKNFDQKCDTNSVDFKVDLRAQK